MDDQFYQIKPHRYGVMSLNYDDQIRDFRVTDTPMVSHMALQV